MSKQEAQTVAPTPSMWHVLKTTWHSVGNVVSTTCRVAEKGVGLVENELDNLQSLQDIRLAETQSELQALPKPKA